MKTKIKFSDIAEMLERDEMKEIVGGSGYTYSGGSGGGSNFVSGTALGGGGSSFGGANFNYSGGGMGGGLSSNYGPSNSSYGSNSYGSGTSSSSVNQSAYDYYASLYGVGPKTAQNSATYGVYNPNGVNLNSGSYYGGYNPEDGVIIIKNPKTYAPVPGSSIDLNNLFNPNMNYNPNTGSFMASVGSSPNTITPSPDFLASPFGSVYNKLVSQNNSFLCLLDKYNPSKKLSLNLIYSEIQNNDIKNFDAQTTSTYINGVLSKVSIQFDPSKVITTITRDNLINTYERSEIGKATDIIHEALHAYSTANNIPTGANHNVFNEYRDLMISTLLEYNSDNKLGFTYNQINELAYKGTTNSTEFSTYIQTLANTNKTSYNTELANYDKRLSDLNWSLISTKTN